MAAVHSVSGHASVHILQYTWSNCNIVLALAQKDEKNWLVLISKY